MQPKHSKLHFWKRRGWLRYPLLVLLLVGTAVALRGGLWSQTPAKAAKRAAKRSLRAKTKPLPKVQMFLEHNERDINLKINKGKYVLPQPIITREDQKVIVELAGVQVRPRKWTLSGSRVASINVKVDKKGSRLVIAQDPKVAGTLKDAFSAEDVNGNLVLRVLNQSIGDKQAHPAHPALQPELTKIVNASTAPIPKTKAKHPLSQKLNRKAPLAVSPSQGTLPTKPSNANLHRSASRSAKLEGHGIHTQPATTKHPHAKPIDTHQVPHDKVPHASAEHRSPVQVVEHAPKPSPKPHPVPVQDASDHPSVSKSAWSLVASVLAFGLLALVPVLWWKKKQGAPTQDIKVQERLALSPKHSLVRVKLGAKDLWLGLSEGNIQVITPASPGSTKAPPVLSVAPDLHATQHSAEAPRTASEPDLLPEPMPAAAPPTLARRKLAAFKMRLREALAHPDSEPDMDLSQSAGRQADAIRQELARRQAQSMTPSDSRLEEHVA